MGIFFSGISTIFSRLIEHTVEISVLICLIFCIKIIVSKKLPPWWHYSLWLMLLIRMMLPLDFENRLNVYNFVPPIASQNVFELITENPSGQEIPTSKIASEIPPGELKWRFIIKKSIPVLWFTGAMILGVCIAFESLAFWMCIRRKLRVTDSAVLDLLAQCKRRMKIQKPVDIIISDSVKSPALFGYLHPRLLLPEGILEKLNFDELSYAFMHELGHLKRHDIAVSWLIAVLQVAYWFNPLVWIAFYQLRVDQESACDVSVLSRIRHNQSTEYAKAIVGFLEKFCQNCQLPSLAGILENKTQMKKRITRIVHYRKISQKMTVAAVALLVSTGFVFFTFTGVAMERQRVSLTGTTPEKIYANASSVLEGAALDEMEKSLTRRPELRYAEYDASMDSKPKPEDFSYSNEKHESVTEVLSGLGKVTPLQEKVPKGINAMNDRPVHIVQSSSTKVIQKLSLAVDPGSESGKLSETWRNDKRAVEPPDNSTPPLEKPILSAAIKQGKRVKADDSRGMIAQTKRFFSASIPAVTEMGDNGSHGNIPLNSAVVTGEKKDVESNQGTFIQAGVNDRPAHEPQVAERNTGLQYNQDEFEGALQSRASGETFDTGEEPESGEFRDGVAKAILANAEPIENSSRKTYLMSDIDTPPRVLRACSPKYPYLARQNDISGYIKLRFVVNKDGQAINTKVVESYPKGVFDESALEAIEAYRFTPGIKDGKAVDVKVNLPIKFKLS